MVRRNSARNVPPRVSRRRGQNRNNLAKMVSRLAAREPYKVACPQDPPPFRSGITIEKYIHFVISVGTTADDYGSPVLPGNIKIGATDNQKEISNAMIVRMVSQQWFSVATTGASSAIFEAYSVRKACLWGSPVPSVCSQISVTLDPTSTVRVASSETNVIVQGFDHPSPVFLDYGSPSTRARVSVSTPAPSWFKSELFSDMTDINTTLGFVQTGSSNHVAYCSILVRAVSGRSL